MMFENIQVKHAAPVLSRGQVVVSRHANGARVGAPGCATRVLATFWRIF